LKPSAIPARPSAVRARCADLGLQPSRRRGQNFLADANWIAKVLRVAELPADRPVVEIGPGLGALTAGLLAAGKEVYAIESDGRLIRWLEDTLARDDPEHLHLLAGDAVEHPQAGAPPSGERALLSNLPFAITSPWLDALLTSSAPLPDPLVLILQEEGAARLRSSPGRKEYGPSAIRAQLAYEAGASHAVPAAAFEPRPGVPSRLLRWSLRRAPRLLAPAEVRLLRSLFLHRRKTLASALRRELPATLRASWEEHLRAAGYDDRARPAEIGPEDWWELFRRARDHRFPDCRSTPPEPSSPA
jgi:16S rRNA (adenine1518-N6/adenine1519-N6)-dimethyltransferase